MRRLRATTVLTAGVAAAATALGFAPAQAAPSVSDPIATGLAGPLQMEVTKGGILVGQSFAGLLSKVRWNGSVQTLAAVEPTVEGGSAEIAGVAARGRWIAYTVTQYGPENPSGGPSEIVGAELWVRSPSGRSSRLADMLAFERRYNPDRHKRYGFLGLSDSCAEQVPAEVGGGEPYPGIVDSHPYAVAKAPHGGWYVADAGANAVLRVSRTGRITVPFVGNPQPVRITATIASMMGLPDCTVGKRYAFESVPTDVEVTRKGHLVVSQLPGGPEDPSLGARGSVVKVHPKSGRVHRLVSGLLGAANVAVGKHGKVYVTELFSGEVSEARRGGARTLVPLPQAAALEHFRGKLYASTNVFGDGAIVRIRR